MAKSSADHSNLSAVARLAGVSIATASRVINGNGPAAAKTHEKVMVAARKLGYVPDPRFRAMGQRNAARDGHIGLILNSTSKAMLVATPFYGRLFWSIEQAASEAGRHILLTTLEDDAEEYLPRFARDMQVDGAIVIDHVPLDTVKRLDQLVPVVMVNAPGDDLDIPRVMPNETETVRVGLRHLRKLGHRRVAFFDIADNDNRPHRQRVKEFKQATALSDDWWEHTRCEVLPARQHSLVDECKICLKKWMGEKNPPTAIFCACDLYAEAFAKAAESLGIGVPSQISLLGIDDDVCAIYCRPALTTIRQPFAAMGQLAVRMILDRIEQGADYSHPSVSLNVELVERESTGPAK